MKKLIFTLVMVCSGSLAAFGQGEQEDSHFELYKTPKG